MLSRVANSLYWMARYIERAENIARIVDVNLQLLMKLIGTSLATGLERIRIEARLAKLEERTNLSQSSMNDGLWDFDVENNEVYTPRRTAAPRPASTASSC